MSLLHDLIVAEMSGGGGGGGSVDSSVAVYVPYAELTNAKIETLIAEGKTPYTIWTKTDGSSEQIVYYFSFRKSATMHYFVGWDNVTTISSYSRDMSVLVVADNGSGQTTRVRASIEIPTRENLNNALAGYTLASDFEDVAALLPIKTLEMTLSNGVMSLNLTSIGGIAKFAVAYYRGKNFLFILPITQIDPSSSNPGAVAFTITGAYSASDPAQMFLAVASEYNGIAYSAVLRPVNANTMSGTLTATPVGTKRVVMTAQDETAELQPNVLYVFPKMANLTITLAAITYGTIANEYHFFFTSGATATVLTMPNTVVMPDGFEVEASTVYEISVLDNYALVASWPVAST